MHALKTKKFLVYFLKFVVGLCLVTYVLKANLVNFGEVTHVLFSPFYLLSAFAILTLLMVCLSWRMHLLSRSSSSAMSFWEMFEISMIGLFFSSFLPGTVGGDFVRVWYLSKSGKQKISISSQAVIWDRAIGLTVNCLVAAIAVTYLRISGETQEFVGKVQLASYAVTSGLLLIGIFFIFFASRLKPAWILNSRFAPVWHFLTGFLPSSSVLFRSVVLSSGSALLSIVFAVFCGNALGIKLDIWIYAVMIPIGILVSAIPILPLGIGLGQVAYANLFVWLANAPSASGATLCTLMQGYNLLFSFLGVFPYLKGVRAKETMQKG